MKKSRSFMIKTGVIAVGIAAIAAVSATALSGTALSATAAVTASHPAAHAAAARDSARLDGAYTNCPAGDWCIFKGLNGTGARLAHPGNWPVTYKVAFRNTDESFANRTSGLVRFYYSINYQGGYICVNSGGYANDAAYYAFYETGSSPNTSTGSGITVFQQIASIGVARGNCGNPLPLP